MKNNLKIYDAIIIGGGVIGTSIARFLSRFKGEFLLLEKHNDVGEETTNANSAIVHSGYDPLPNTLKAKYNVLGNKMMEQVCEELDVPLIKNGSLTVSLSDEDNLTLENLLKRATLNGVDARILNYEELHELEPNLSKNCLKALFCKDSMIISPFNLCVNFMENAMDNGFELKLNSKVINIIKDNDLYKIKLENNEEILTKVLINASGVYSDEVLNLLEKPTYKINPRKGEYYVLDHFDNNFLKHTIFMCPTKVGKGVLISPTTSSNYIIGPSNDESSKDDYSTDKETLNSIVKIASKLIDNLPLHENIRQFAGIRANPSNDDFIIEESKINKNFFNVGGIMSPGLASSPAIGKYVSELVAKNLELEVNEQFNPFIRKHYSSKKLSKEKYNELIKKDSKYGKMICRCEKISEGEIVDSILRNCGAHTVKGVKKRVRPGFGKCQGTFCQSEVVKILARELHKELSEINYSELNTEIFKSESKENGK